MMRYQKNNINKFSHSHILILLLTLTTIFAATVSISTAQADDQSHERKILSGWLPYYGLNQGIPSALNNSDLISEISPFWYTYTDSQTIKDLYTSANPYLPISTTITQLKNNGLILIPTITDGMSKGGMAKVIADPNLRSNLINQILQLINSNGYDGIELDFEVFAFVDPQSTWSTTATNWVTFIAQLSAALHQENKLLAIDSPVQFDPASGKKGYWVYSWAAIAPYIDRLRIMGYDYSTSTPGPIGPINWEKASLTYAISVIPASKVYLGIPGYGRNWTRNVIGICPSDVSSTVSPKSPAATFIQSGADTLANSLGATVTYDSATQEATFTYQKTYNGFTANQTPTSCTASGVVWYQNDQSFLARANLVAQYHLGGISEWTLGFESDAAISKLRTFAASIAPDPVLTTLTAPNTSYRYGELIPLTIHSTRSDQTALPGISAHLQRENSDGSWSDLVAGPTDANGNLTFNLLLGKSSALRVITDGTWDKAKSISKTATLQIQPQLTLQAPGSVALGRSYTLTGNIWPQIAGKVILLDSGNGVQQTKTGSDGSFAFLITPSTTGIQILNLSVKDDPGASAAALTLVR